MRKTTAHGRKLARLSAFDRQRPVIDTAGAEVPPLATTDLNTPVRALMTWRDHRDAFLGRYQCLKASLH